LQVGQLEVVWRFPRSSLQGHTQRGVLGLNPPFELDILRKFITCAKEINYFRIGLLFAC